MGEVAVIDFMVVKEFYDREIKRRIGDVALSVDEQSVIMGEVLLVLGNERPMLNNKILPTLRELLEENTTTDIKNSLLNGVHSLIHNVMDRSILPSHDIMRIKPVGGYTIAVMGVAKLCPV